MHEMSLCMSMIDLLGERMATLGPVRVLRVGVEVGALGHVEPEALHFCFASAARGTALDGAALDIRVVPGKAYCFSCAREVAIAARGDACPRCAGVQLRVADGEQLRVMEVEVA